MALYIFRIVLGLGLFAFMCMLYWSSTLIEDRMETIRSEMAQTKNDLYTLRTDVEKSNTEILETIAQRCAFSASKASELSVPDTTQHQSAQSSAQYPNLLVPDPFFHTVLPKLLGKDFVPHGIQQVATVGKPDNLHPFSNWAQVSAWQGMCGIAVAKSKFGMYETLSPDMALRMEERKNAKSGKPEFWIFLRDNVFWQPLQQRFFSSDLHLAAHFLHKHQVTADDYKFFFDVMKNPYVQEQGAVSLRTYYDALEEIEIVDKLTFIVRWRTKEIKNREGKMVPTVKYIAKQLTGGLRPLAGFVYKYFADGTKIIQDDAAPDTYRTNSVWAQNFADHWAKNIIVSCGPWSFEGMNDRQIEFKRTRDFYDPLGALTEGIESEFKDSPDNIWQAFKANRLESYNLQPDKLAEFKTFMASDSYQQQAQKGDTINRLDFVGRSYSYIGWNQVRPYFKSPKVRRALTMAIDRRRIINEYLSGLGVEVTGTFARSSPAYDPSITPWPFNPQEARRLLEDEGWYDSQGVGIIDKMVDGQRIPFRFSLTYFVKNPTTKSVCEYIATALKEVGIDCRLNGVDIADLSAVFDDKSFDAVCLAWALGVPPEDPRQLWHSSGATEKGSSNAIGFSNVEVDKIIDALDYEYDSKKRLALYHRFNAIIHELQPYTFLYTAKTAFLYRNYLKNVFIPAERQDLVPGANMAEPDSSIFWLDRKSSSEDY